MSDREIRIKATVWAVLAAVGLQTTLGLLCLWLGIRGSRYEMFLAIALWVVAIAFGLASYRRKLRAQPLSVAQAAAAVAGFTLFFWITGTDAFGR